MGSVFSKGGGWLSGPGPSKPAAVKAKIAEVYGQTSKWEEPYTRFVATAASFMADAAYIHMEDGQHPLVFIMKDGRFRLLPMSLYDAHAHETFFAFDIVYPLLGIQQNPVISPIELMMYEWDMTKLDAERALNTLDAVSRMHLNAIEWRKLADYYASQLPPCVDKEDLYHFCNKINHTLAGKGRRSGS